MFDNRWDNWSGDFCESFSGGLFDPVVREHVPEILDTFGKATRAFDANFPDEVSPGTFARVMTDAMPRLALPDAVRPHLPEVIANFLEYLQESGRVGEGKLWGAEIRVLAKSYGERLKPGGGVKGTTIRKPVEASAVGRNDPCPCGSGKKYKKCCIKLAS